MTSALIETLERPTLVLNRDWYPILATTTRRAIGLVSGGAAKIVDSTTYEVHDLESWDAVSRARDRFAKGRIRSMRLCIEPPEVVVLTGYRGLGKRAVVFSRRALYHRDRYTCQYCGAQPGTSLLSIDHVLPRCRGGVSSWENCVLACMTCNARKAARTPQEVGMRLLSKPQKPRWSPVCQVPSEDRCESWSHFLSRAYWDVELQP